MMAAKTMYQMVFEFHRDFGHPTPNTPGWLHPERLSIRRKWQEEERVEFDEAVAKQDLVAAADALADELYFLLGTCVEMGLPMDHIFAAVHESNMGKAQRRGPHNITCGIRSGRRCDCLKIKYNEEGKTMKPDGWRPPEPEITRILKVR